MTPFVPESFSPPVRRLQSTMSLPLEALAGLERLLQERVCRVEMQEDLVREGEPPRVMRMILSGWACRYKVLQDGRRQIINFLLPGDTCDLRNFLLDAMDHSIGAITPVTFAEVGPAQIDRLLAFHPALEPAMWTEHLVHAAIQREWAVNLGRRDAYERIAHIMCEAFLRLRRVGLTRGLSCDFPLTQSDLADAVGISLVHVNRTLQDLRADRLIELRSRVLSLSSLQALQEAALFNANYLHLKDSQRLDANFA